MKHTVDLLLEFWECNSTRIYGILVRLHLSMGSTLIKQTVLLSRYGYVGIKDGLVVDHDQSRKHLSLCLREVKVVIDWELCERLPTIEVHIESVGLTIVMNFNLQVEILDVEIHRPEPLSRIQCLIGNSDFMLSELEPRKRALCVVTEE